MTKRASIMVPRINLSEFEDRDEVIRVDPSKCRTGCPTQDHKSYAECCKGLSLAIGEALTLKQKSVDSELKAYRNARAEGMQPRGTQMHQIEQAKRMSDATGVAFGV